MRMFRPACIFAGWSEHVHCAETIISLRRFQKYNEQDPAVLCLCKCWAGLMHNAFVSRLFRDTCLVISQPTRMGNVEKCMGSDIRTNLNLNDKNTRKGIEPIA